MSKGLRRGLAAGCEEIDRRLPDAVDLQHLVDWVIKETADRRAPQIERRRAKSEILDDVAGLDQRETITALAIFRGRPFEERGDEDDDGGVERQCGLRETLAKIL